MSSKEICPFKTQTFHLNFPYVRSVCFFLFAAVNVDCENVESSFQSYIYIKKNKHIVCI